MAGGKDSKLEGEGDLLNVTLKNLTKQNTYMTEQLVKITQQEAEIKASLQVTNERIQGIITKTENKSLPGDFIRNPLPANNDYDDTSLKWYVPEFSGIGDAEDFFEWVRQMDKIFDYKGFDDQKSYIIANMKLTRYASLWFDNLKLKLTKEGAPRIKTWTEIKRQLKNFFGVQEYIPHKVVKKDEIALNIVHVEDKHTENYLNEDNAAIQHDLGCVEHETRDVSEKSYVEHNLLVRIKQMFSEYFAPQSLVKQCKKLFLAPFQSCIFIAFYKTRGRVFSNKGRMMRNGSGSKIEFLYGLNIIKIKKNNIHNHYVGFSYLVYL